MISVIIPVYNAEAYLAECVQSLLDQSYTDIEIILVNDGSSDKSKDICDSFTKKDSRVQVIHQANSGVSCARNVGIRLAKGEWLCFVDSDDIVDRDYLKQFIEKTTRGSDYFIQSRSDLVGSEISIRFKYSNLDFVYGKDLIPSDILENAVPWGKLFRTKIIKNNNIKFNEKISWGEDTLFTVTYLSHTSKITTLSYSGYYYRKNTSNSLSKRRIDPIELCCYSLEYATRLKLLAPNVEIKHSFGDQEVLNAFKYAFVNAASFKYSLSSFKQLYYLARQAMSSRKINVRWNLSNTLFYILALLPYPVAYAFSSLRSCLSRLNSKHLKKRGIDGVH